MVVCRSFNHVAPVSTLDQAAAAIRRPDINLVYTPLPISAAGQDYLDSIVLGAAGDFAAIDFEKRNKDISPHKNISVIEAASRAELEPGIVAAQMTRLPQRHGRGDFIEALSSSLKTFWDAQDGARPITAFLMEKEPTATPNIHFDGMEDGRFIRGLVTLKGRGTTYIDNGDAHIIDGGDLGYRTVLGPVEKLRKEVEMRELPEAAFSLHKGIILKTVPRFGIGPAGVIQCSAMVADVMAAQNPLGHAEASAKDCGGALRLQWMIDQISEGPPC